MQTVASSINLHQPNQTVANVLMRNLFLLIKLYYHISIIRSKIPSFFVITGLNQWTPQMPGYIFTRSLL